MTCAASAAKTSPATRCRGGSSSATTLPKTNVGKVLRRALRDEVLGKEGGGPPLAKP